MKCFETLGLPATANADEIKACWRQLCRIHHPDRGGNAVDFDMYRKAYNEAMKTAEEPLICKVCGGAGKKSLSNGFTTLKMSCKPCGGKGHVKRG